ncbi:MAG: class II aldolase/adducin family protein [candidate division Zixibacteria bacterium]|nr:class II aldolase/adducin family protein [candidate division Zixibacteria bacterium]
MAGRLLSERQMLAGSGGNMSIRLDRDRVLITRSGVAKGRLTPDDIILVDPDGRHVRGDGEPSTEMLMHLFVYRERPDVMACVHSHPPYATAFAVAGIPLEADILPEVVVYVGDIPLTKYASPGTNAVPESLAPYVKDHNAFLLANHGLLTVGKTLEQALNRHETVEQLARILAQARQLGAVNRIPRTDIDRLSAIRRDHD